MSHALGSEKNNADAPARCVLLVGEAGAVPSSLVGALDRRGMDIVIVRQPPRVFCELVPAEKPADRATAAPSEHDESDEAIASSGGGEISGGGGQSVVVVEPEQQPRIGELRHALATYYPRVRCWRYEAHGPGDRPRLDAFDLPLPPESSADSPAGRVKGSGQRLRDVVVRVDPSDPGREPDDGPLVSEEELAMLLAPDPAPGSNTPAPGSSNPASG